MKATDLAGIWTESGLPDYYESHRQTTGDVYPSEWLFLQGLLTEGMSVLDVGCAVGGFASIIGEHVNDFRYTGVDVSPEMVNRARLRHPHHAFHTATDEELTVLGTARYDLVLCLGVLHLTDGWRKLLDAVWRHSNRWLLFDLRESFVKSLEDRTVSSMRMDSWRTDGTGRGLELPYNVINAADARRTIVETCTGCLALKSHAYLGGPSDAARTPIQHVFMTTYCLEREG